MTFSIQNFNFWVGTDKFRGVTDVFSYKFVWENWTAISEHFEFGSDWVLSTRGNWFSPTAILRRIHPIPSELGS